MAAKPNIPLLSRAPKPDEVSRRVNSIIRWIYSIGPILTSLKDMITVQDLVNTGLFKLVNNKLTLMINLDSGVSIVKFTQAHLVGTTFTYEHGRDTEDVLVQIKDENDYKITTGIEVNSKYVIVDVSAWGSLTGKIFTMIVYG